jgi:hypothetical protein
MGALRSEPALFATMGSSGAGLSQRSCRLLRRVDALEGAGASPESSTSANKSRPPVDGAATGPRRDPRTRYQHSAKENAQLHQRRSPSPTRRRHNQHQSNTNHPIGSSSCGPDRLLVWGCYLGNLTQHLRVRRSHRFLKIIKQGGASSSCIRDPIAIERKQVWRLVGSRSAMLEDLTMWGRTGSPSVGICPKDLLLQRTRQDSRSLLPGGAKTMRALWSSPQPRGRERSLLPDGSRLRPAAPDRLRSPPSRGLCEPSAYATASTTSGAPSRVGAIRISDTAAGYANKYDRPFIIGTISLTT